MITRARLASLLLSSVLILTLAGAALAGPGDDAAAQALRWLATQQNADGGFSGGFSPGSSVGPTADAVLAIVTMGQDASTWKKDGRSPLDYLRAHAQTAKAGELGAIIRATLATGGDPHNVGGADLVKRLEGLHKSGGYGGTLYEDTLAVLALANAGETIPDDVLARIQKAQTADGAWAFTGDTAAGAGDTNTTSLVVQALVAMGHRDAVGRALDYFRRTQNSDGGWPYQVPSQYGTETDANSTANVIQALVAAGESLGNWSVAGRSDPLGALIHLQDKSGAMNYQASSPGANVFATIQAIPALKGVAFARVPVIRSAGQVAAPSGAAPAQQSQVPQTLPQSGGETSPVMPLILVAAGGLLTVAGRLIARCRAR